MGNEFSIENKISYAEFFKRAIIKLRDLNKSKGIHSVYSGFNNAFRQYYIEDPIAITQDLARQDFIEIQPRRGGVMIYLPGEGPKQATKSADETLSIIFDGDCCDHDV